MGNGPGKRTKVSVACLHQIALGILYFAYCIDMETGPARYNPMDAQRFDPLRRTNMRLVSLFKTGSSHLMRQDPCIRTEKTSASDAWPNHKVGSRPSLTDTCSTSATPVDVYHPADIVVTRTIIRPNPNPHRRPTRMLSRTQMVFKRMFSRAPSPASTYSFSPSSPSSASTRSTPPSRFKGLVLNCFSASSAFDSKADDMQMHRRERPVLLAIVKETRERYEDDQAFKEIVGSVIPAAGVRGGA
ncbi:uncharacterized protein F5147DRAFT_693055 [Suillus discolor]|uniref:Uncharacterized protein n=1 Tax=Suillus discolor TaxID=1912936 RepID=A0A9P7JUQ6_9AGAM|nr:uncharacterized protein F5147DRAFT_693055 [Suillus discolor]KAG2109375.1 hypothetical protein F5147DRAFT_693055 [Suillus discolor]